MKEWRQKQNATYVRNRKFFWRFLYLTFALPFLSMYCSSKCVTCVVVTKNLHSRIHECFEMLIFYIDIRVRVCTLRQSCRSINACYVLFSSKAHFFSFLFSFDIQLIGRQKRNTFDSASYTYYSNYHFNWNMCNLHTFHLHGMRCKYHSILVRLCDAFGCNLQVILIYQFNKINQQHF